MRSTGVEGAQEYRNEYPWQDFYENMPKVIVSGIAPPGVFAHRLTEGSWSKGFLGRTDKMASIFQEN
eukprot:scaffold4870_cov23-Tisochrysis_lutea.AAC.1